MCTAGCVGRPRFFIRQSTNALETQEDSRDESCHREKRNESRRIPGRRVKNPFRKLFLLFASRYETRENFTKGKRMLGESFHRHWKHGAREPENRRLVVPWKDRTLTSTCRKDTSFIPKIVPLVGKFFEQKPIIFFFYKIKMLSSIVNFRIEDEFDIIIITCAVSIIWYKMNIICSWTVI